MPLDKFILPKATLQERISTLTDSCDAMERISYDKKLTPAERDELKHILSEDLIALNRLDEENAEFKATMKARMTPHKEAVKETTATLRRGATSVEERCFKLIDPSQKLVGYYNDEGELVYERAAVGNELNGTIFQMQREGTND